MKDGGEESFVKGYWLVEWKSMFSIVLLEFGNGSRNMYHNHAFNCFSWLIKGKLREEFVNKDCNLKPTNYILPSLIPFMTYKDTFHKVTSYRTSWVLSFRGPWNKTWKEYNPENKQYAKLANGRRLMPD